MTTRRTLQDRNLNMAKAVTWYGYGGTDITDEWSWNGNDYTDLREGQIGNKYAYHISLYAHRDRNWKPRSYKIVVRLRFGQVDSMIINESGFKNRKLAFARMAEALREFEASDRFATEIWPMVTHITNRLDIFKKVRDGSFIWIASSYAKKHEILCGNDGTWWSFPLGTGEFYVRTWRHNWRTDIVEESWTEERVGGTCMSGGVKRENVPEAVLRLAEPEVIAS